MASTEWRRYGKTCLHAVSLIPESPVFRHGEYVNAIQNVHGYVDEQGTVWLNAKDVAIGRVLMGRYDSGQLRHCALSNYGKESSAGVTLIKI